MSTKRDTKQRPRPTVTVRVWDGQSFVELVVDGPLSVFGKGK